MELNITKLVDRIDPWDLSNSVANLGPRAAELTWGNCLEAARGHSDLLDTEEKKQAARDHFKAYGAWDDIDEWDIEHLTAATIQEIAARLNEIEHYGELGSPEVEQAASDGNIVGNLYQGCDGEIYFYLGM